MYHMQRVEGDLVRTIREHVGQIGHVHVADNPGRHQPGTGEINYRFVLRALDEAGYDGYVGLEYVPPGRTEDCFEWLPRAIRGVPSTADDLNL
jgi:hydroxypyruvate isomerase